MLLSISLERSSAPARGRYVRRLLSKHKDKLLENHGGCAAATAFPEEEFEKQKQRLSELFNKKDDANTIAGNVAQMLRYGSHPTARVNYRRRPSTPLPLIVTKAYYENYFMPNTARRSSETSIRKKPKRLPSTLEAGRREPQ